jgi:hypothetical protein
MANLPFPEELTPDQEQYLQGLRGGYVNDSLLIVRTSISVEALEDLHNFKVFLSRAGHPNPTQSELSFTIDRENFLLLLEYADDRRCLVLQTCFGFDIAPTRDGDGILKVGKLLLIHKGNFHQKGDQTDVELYFGDTVFRNEQGKFEFFANLNLKNPLSIDTAANAIDNFISIYPANRTETNDPFIHGFQLPVKPLISLLSPNNLFGNFDRLTIYWGLTRFNDDGTLGNFSLVIGTGDFERDPVIEFRTENIAGPSQGDCPPKTGCKIRR